ncbi:uncharacterized protein METZ01_LOCUS161619 [marine metagenome]|uniref:Tyrosine specific protein phosphatases domain-containing protein n=1 Tax=marine metagenome TaxID=408172 RepID=A0A382B4T6_9ZZZZ
MATICGKELSMPTTTHPTGRQEKRLEVDLYETINSMSDSYQLTEEGVFGPTNRSYWVVEGRFAAGAYPSKKGYTGSGPTPKRLELLVDAGIDVFINLTQDYPGGTDSHMSPYDPGVEGRAEVVRCPVPDEHLPACPLEGSEAREAARGAHFAGEGCPDCPNDRSRAETKEILDRIDSALEEGQNVYAHCWGGSGRTGTIVGCWIRRHGLAGADEVLDMLAKLRLGDRDGGMKPTPNTSAQAEFIVSWGEGE